MTAAKSLLALALLGSQLMGCAHEAGEARAPAPQWDAGWVRPASEQYTFPPRTLAAKGSLAKGSLPAALAAAVPAKPRGVTPAKVTPSPLRFAAAPGVPTYPDGRPRPLDPALIAAEFPAGDACVERLRDTGVSFQPVSDKRGVDTPIAVDAPLGGVRYFTLGGGPMIADCRLALALVRVAPELRELGISAVRFSGAYSYRMARVGRLSLHAYGLALDVHEVIADGKSYVVARDFGKGLANGCSNDAPLLNRLACHLAQLRVFQELLTPDSNADHHDHLHVAIARVPR
jgi:hypothetical protein